jgi:hypothetical protein
VPKSGFAHEVDEIQRELRPCLAAAGFKVRGRTFNRLSADRCTCVVNIQMGPSEPPGTTYIPGLCENLHGFFAVNLGVYVPEVARESGAEAKSWIQEYYCCVRQRLGTLIGNGTDVWWRAVASRHIVEEVRQALILDGLAFLERYDTRDKIISEWRGQAESLVAGRPPRIVLAIIHAKRGESTQARRLLTAQASESTRNPGHRAYVRTLARKLGLGELEGADA